MITSEHTMTFLGPAFLGDADQSGAWRTPAFKALLRHWWRVAIARDVDYNVDAMRVREGKLFGTAFGHDKKPLQSQVRLRLEKWRSGSLRQWNGRAGGSVKAGENSIPASLYLGYGPIAPGKPPVLKKNAAIQAGEFQALRMAIATAAEAKTISAALDLIEAYGTVGGRSRNGWGSLSLGRDLSGFEPPLIPWQDAIARDWAHAVGVDERGPLVWQTPTFSGWEGVVGVLAQMRADMRRAVSDRLLLAYPSTRQSMPGWSNDARVPHQLRFKLRRDGDGLCGVVVHLPCRPSKTLWDKLSVDKQRQFPDVLQEAHRFFDKHKDLRRIPA